jgi:hypothetical protein
VVCVSAYRDESNRSRSVPVVSIWEEVSLFKVSGEMNEIIDIEDGIKADDKIEEVECYL